ncbi:MAG: phosphopyruvate hydratase [Candidatus Woesearchaeota archaeon]
MFKIKEVRARQVLDSRGNPTVEAEVHTAKFSGSAIVPSGASTGIHEAVELRDGGKEYLGFGVLRAVDNVNTRISRKLNGLDVREQEKIDKAMITLDGTANKKSLGANAILAASMACARCAANSLNKPLYRYIGGSANPVMPTPFMNVINGGKHADNGLSFQEFMIVPKANSFAERLRIGSEVYHVLKGIIRKRFGSSSTNVGDEGGFAPAIKRVEEPFILLQKTLDKLGYSNDVKFAMDCASSEFYNAKKRHYLVDGKKMDAEKLARLYARLAEDYPIVSIEDPFAQDDWIPWIQFTKDHGRKIQVVGDDLLVTNPVRIHHAVDMRACNALLLKVNQIGSLTEAIKAAKVSLGNKWNVMVSHRSGETEDTFIADLAVGLGTGQLKSGAPCRTERVAKFNRLLRIEEELNDKKRRK